VESFYKSDIVVKQKSESICQKYNLQNSPYIAESLYVARYEAKEQGGREIDNPNRRLALIGDRVLKLVLTEHEYLQGKSVEEINDFVKAKESNKYLATKEILTAKDGFCIDGEVVTENKKKSDKEIISTMTEALIGAIYLQEMKTKRTFENARSFIQNHIF
jgi:dsRNA-specific ribonuclease